MKDDVAALISVNYAVRDSEIEEIESLMASADPGDWRVKDGALARYAGPFERPAESLTFAAKARSIVPRLIRGLRVLEDAYAVRRAEVASYRNELAGARLDSRATAERAAAGKTGPSWELGLVARYAALFGRVASSKDDGDAAYIEQLLRRWTGGESIGDEIRSSVESIERRVKEREAFDAEQATADEARRDQLKGWLRRLEAGDVPIELARSWAKLTAAERNGTRTVAGGGGVTFRNRFPAAPSSITLSVNSASGGFSGTPSTGYADRDGFGFFSYQSLAGAATAYWFGSYTAIA